MGVGIRSEGIMVIISLRRIDKGVGLIIVNLLSKSFWEVFFGGRPRICTL